MPVLQVPAGEEGEPGGSPNLLREEEQEEDEEEKKKLNNHIVEIHKDPTSGIIWGVLRHQITFYFPPFSVCQNSSTPVARTSNKNQTL